MNIKIERVAQPKSFMYAKAKPPKTKKEIPTYGKGKTNSQTICNYDINYFRCLGSEHIVF